MSVYQKILNWLEAELFEGRLHLGQSLPDDRKLADIIRASHSSTREALKYLETMGVLRLYEGKRKTIIAHLVSEPAASVTPALRLHMASSRYPVRDLIQARILLETFAVENADPTNPAMDELERILEKMQYEGTTPHTFHQLEVDFHIALTKLSGNQLITGLMTALRTSLTDYLLSIMGRVPLWSATATRLRAEYRALLEAIRYRDTTLAKQLLIANIERQYTEASLDLNEETAVAHELPGTVVAMEPIEIDDDDLIPDHWEEAIAPSLIEALENVGTTPATTAETTSPQGDTASENLESEPSSERPKVQRWTLAQEYAKEQRKDEVSAEEQELGTSTEEHTSISTGEENSSEISAQEETPSHSKTSEADNTSTAEHSSEHSSAAVSEEKKSVVQNDPQPPVHNVLRAPTAGRTRKVRGTVSVPVHATVIKPIYRTPHGETPIKIRKNGDTSWTQPSSDTLRAKPVARKVVPGSHPRVEEPQESTSQYLSSSEPEKKGNAIGRWLGFGVRTQQVQLAVEQKITEQAKDNSATPSADTQTAGTQSQLQKTQTQEQTSEQCATDVVSSEKKSIFTKLTLRKGRKHVAAIDEIEEKAESLSADADPQMLAPEGYELALDDAKEPQIIDETPRLSRKEQRALEEEHYSSSADSSSEEPHEPQSSTTHTEEPELSTKVYTINKKIQKKKKKKR
ncbi:FadR/GntR family transcriptional regulator [Rothia sp. P7208]|uniref:FadR/GntR family transcriptional regulator n=1 Tax=Rothia sp. P7208 TaxID=3402660 RepID=UPI003ACC3BC5